MPEIKKRGRPSKENQTETDSNYCTIRDPLMEPFYIQKDRYNYTIIEKSISTRGFAGKKATGKEVEKVVGYYSTFGNALYKISKLKFHNAKGEYNSIQEYMESWNELKNGLKTLLNKIEI
tara:strand:- start:479 stop:838 length:360 start_codon:yes stop_codon:yes gene_type:complete